MARSKLTNTEIEMRIVPTMRRWPPVDVAKTIAWDKAREAVDLLRTLILTVDAGCRQAEQDTDLSPEGIARRREALGRQALSELENWSPLRAAERAITENIDYLEKKMTDLPQPPAAVADVMLAQEIRAHIRRQKSRIDVAVKSISDPRMLGAILTAPACLSGLSDAEWNLVRERARAALHPEQSEMQKQLRKSLEDLRGGIEGAKQMVRERCQIAEPESSNSEALAGTKSVAA